MDSPQLLLESASAEIARLADCASQAADAMRERMASREAAPAEPTTALVQAIQDRTERFHQEARELAEMLARARTALPSGTSTEQSPSQPKVLPGSVAAESVAAGSGLMSSLSPIRRSAFMSRPDSARCPAEGIRLLATQMAVAGSTRDAIGTKLAREFGVGDPQRVLDELFAEAS